MSHARDYVVLNVFKDGNQTGRVGTGWFQGGRYGDIQVEPEGEPDIYVSMFL